MADKILDKMAEAFVKEGVELLLPETVNKKLAKKVKQIEKLQKSGNEEAIDKIVDILSDEKEHFGIRNRAFTILKDMKTERGIEPGMNIVSNSNERRLFRIHLISEFEKMGEKEVLKKLSDICKNDPDERIPLVITESLEKLESS